MNCGCVANCVKTKQEPIIAAAAAAATAAVVVCQTVQRNVCSNSMSNT